MSRPSGKPTTLVARKPIFALNRKGVPEILIDGIVVHKLDGDDIAGDDDNTMLVTRSLLKPWQFMAAEAGDEAPFWALGLASHSAQHLHQEHLVQLAEAAEAKEGDLVCPRCYSIDPFLAALMRHQGQQPSRLHHPCSGKHILMIAACRAHGFPIEQYWDSEHPMQKRIMTFIGQSINEKPLWMIDSRGLPTMATSVREIVRMWEKLAFSDDLKAMRVKRLMTLHPKLIGGVGRLDTDLMEVGKGQLLAKEGADGLLVLTSLPEKGQRVATCFVKLASGYNPTYLALALWVALVRMPTLPPAFVVAKEFLRSRLEKWVPSDQELKILEAV